MKRLALLAALVFASVGLGQDPPLKVEGDTQIVQVDQVVVVKKDLLVVNKVPFTLTAPPGVGQAVRFYWDIPAGVTASKSKGSLKVTAAPQGPLHFACEVDWIDFDKKTYTVVTSEVTLNFGGVTPPAPPIPPTPPVPPEPPTPIPGPGFKVLISYDMAKLTPEQQGIVFGKAVRDYLQAKCSTGADGRTKDFRIYPAGTDASGEIQWIRDVLQRHPGASHWMAVSNGTAGYDGPLPANADEAMKILQKYGG